MSPPVSTSPCASSSIDFTITPSSPAPGPPCNIRKDEPLPLLAASVALAHAGLGLGLPPIAFPRPSSPISRTRPAKRKSSGRAVTAHAAEGTSTSNPSLKVEHIRRVKSFSKHENAQGIGEQNRIITKGVDKRSDVLVFSREPRERALSAAPHAHTMPEWSSRDSNVKGK